MLSLSERRVVGKKLREKTPRSSHAVWKRPAKRPDPIALLKASDQGRLPELLPIRYGRMLHSPLAFLRGAASIMATDLAATPVTGLRVQACGDAHLMNFGEFATPERRLVFDVNDFDETLPGPWEWDVKRLVASFAVAGRTLGFTENDSREAAREVGRSYREHMAEYAAMSPLEVWHARIDSKTLVKMKADAASR